MTTTDSLHVATDNLFMGMNLLHKLWKRWRRCRAYDNRQDLTTEIMITQWNDNSVVTMVLNCRGIEP